MSAVNIAKASLVEARMGRQAGFYEFQVVFNQIPSAFPIIICPRSNISSRSLIYGACFICPINTSVESIAMIESLMSNT